MADQSSDDLRRLAAVCRRQAAVTDDREAKGSMIAIAVNYEANALRLDDVPKPLS